MKQRLLPPVIAALASLVIFFALYLLGLFAVIEYWFLDRLFSLRGSLPPPSEVVIVALDEVSYEAFEEKGVSLSQAWPRGLHAELLVKLRSYGVKRVVFDVLFLGEGQDPAQDQNLSRAISEVPVILGAESVIETVSSAGGAYVLEKINQPHGPFLSAAAGMGLVGLPDENGTVRRFLTERAESARHLPSLSEAAAGLSPGDSAKLPSSRDLINYYGPPRTIRTFSFSQVVQDEVSLPENLFKDKVVFVGLMLRTAVGPAQKDTHKSPFGRSNIFGIEIHANAAANLMRGEWITRLSPISEFGLLGALVVVLGAVVWWAPPLTGGVVLILSCVAWCALSYILFLQGMFLPGLSVVGICAPLMLLMSAMYHYLTTRRSEERIKSALELYLSPEMLKELQKNPEALTLGGEKRWATALFSDIANFTTLSEALPAEEVASMLNEYFSELMEVVFEHKGTLVKFIGDSAFVLFGAPISFNDHAARAVRAGIAMQKRIDEFNRNGRYPLLETRIGINTGPMIIGNLGSKRRFDYTAIGDSVNLASRLEGLNKYLGTSILVSESVKKEVKELYPSVRLGKMKVAGKQEGVTLYTILETPLPEGSKKEWEQLLQFIEGRKWDEAEDLMRRLRGQSPEKSLNNFLSFLEGQVAEWRRSSPRETWRGEFEFWSK